MTGGSLCWRKYSTIRVYAYEDKLPLDASPISHIYGKETKNKGKVTSLFC
jgi:hypothetical protein